MIKLKLAQYSAVMGLGLTIIHWGSHGYISLEKIALDRFQGLRNGVVEGLAHDLGYTKPVEYSESDIYEFIDVESRLAGVNPSVIHAMIHQESGGNSKVESHAGAIGLMQVMPFHTGKTCDLKHWSELYDEEKNIRCGIKVFTLALKSQNGNLVHALEEYNGGAKAIGKYPESIAYAKAVLARLARQSLCKINNQDRKQLDEKVNSL